MLFLCGLTCAALRCARAPNSIGNKKGDNQHECEWQTVVLDKKHGGPDPVAEPVIVPSTERCPGDHGDETHERKPDEHSHSYGEYSFDTMDAHGRRIIGLLDGHSPRIRGAGLP